MSLVDFKNNSLIPKPQPKKQASLINIANSFDDQKVKKHSENLSLLEKSDLIKTSNFIPSVDLKAWRNKSQ